MNMAIDIADDFLSAGKEDRLHQWKGKEIQLRRIIDCPRRVLSKVI